MTSLPARGMDRTYNIPGALKTLKSTNWFFLFLFAAFLGVGVGYVVTLIVRPTLLPPALRWGSLTQPATVMLLGVDVTYTQEGRRVKADPAAFNGRSDTILVARLDPIRNCVNILSIPRDTQVQIPGHGMQKVNSANAFGGPTLARETVSSLLGVEIDHYIVLNVHGLVELVNELGGITVEIPKRMKYMDWTAKLKIDLQPGFHTLTGNQAMGFVRFRHDAMGDIGRVQRQELFMRAVMDKALKPESWAHIPRLMEIVRNYVLTDLNDGDIVRMATFIRAVPKANQHLVMMPGKFSGTGDWLVDEMDVRQIAARLTGASWPQATKTEVHVVIENASSHPELGRKLSRFLRMRGYDVIAVKSATNPESGYRSTTKIIAQRANPEDAEMVKLDLGNCGEVLNASIGDIQSSVTIVAGEDLAPLVEGSASGN